MQTWSFLSRSEAETARLGAALADVVLKRSGSNADRGTPSGAWVIALVGPLGAGKTRLVAGIATGLGADRRAVSSPTFVLVQEYAAALPVYHFDTYRLGGAAEFEELGVDEYFAEHAVCLIEWADRVERALPEEHLRVEIERAGVESRRFRLTARGRRYETLLESVARKVGECEEGG